VSTSDEELDELIVAAGKTHVIPPREKPALLERLRDPRVLERAREHLESKDESWRNTAILCLERIGYVLRDQETATLLLAHASAARSKYEVATTLNALHILSPPRTPPGGAARRARDVPLMAERLKWLVRSPRKRDYGPPEISYLVPFLRRFSANPDAEAALTLLAKRADRLSGSERRWLEANAASLG
jgi:hypothetical protein